MPAPHSIKFCQTRTTHAQTSATLFNIPKFYFPCEEALNADA